MNVDRTNVTVLSPRCFRVVSLLLALTACVPYAPDARAAFIARAGGEDTVCRYRKDFDWNWPPPMPPADTGVAAINWTVNLAGAAAPAPSRTLTANIQHTPGVCHTGEGPGPVITFAPITATRPAGMAVNFNGEARQVTHDGHVEVARIGVATRGLGFADPEAVVFIKAEHHDVPPFGFRLVPSFRHPGIIAGPFNISVKPSYRKSDGTIDNTAPSTAPVPVPAGQRDTFPVPRRRNGAHLSNFTMTGSGSGSTTTTLAFLGVVDGVFSELDMDLATMLFVDGNEFVVPYFFNADIDLHVGFDLSQWFLNPPEFSFGDVLAFTGGVNPDYLGVIIGTSEIRFDDTLGFVTDNPYTGMVTIAGGIDGEVSEPPSVLLVALGVALLGIYATPRGRRVAA